MTSGDWILSPSNDLTSELLGEAIASLASSEAFHAGPEARIAAALLRLVSVTARPPSLDDGNGEAYQDALCKALLEYPIDVVELACENWRRVPNHGKWWPTEQDLRLQCEQIGGPRKALLDQARRLFNALEGEEALSKRAVGASPFAGHAHRQFRDAMRARLTPWQHDAYFRTWNIKYSGGRAMLVRTRVAEHILRLKGGDLLRLAGLSVDFDADAFRGEHVPEHPDTPEETEEIARRFDKLKLVLR